MGGGGASDDGLIALGEGALVLGIPGMGSPTAQDERNGSAGGNPLAVVLASDVNVRAGSSAALARGMANVVTGSHTGADGYAILGGDVLIEHIPAGLLEAIAVMAARIGTEMRPLMIELTIRARIGSLGLGPTIEEWSWQSMIGSVSIYSRRAG